MKTSTLNYFVLIVMLAFGSQTIFAQEVSSGDDVVEFIDEVDELSMEDAVEMDGIDDMADMDNGDTIDMVDTMDDMADFEEELAEEAPLAAELPPVEEIPLSVRNNRFFLESVRLTRLAEQSFNEGDFLASIQFSEEAVRQAALSDEFVLLQLKIRETDSAIAAARRRIEFADSINAARHYPDEYSEAQALFTEARRLRGAEQWDDAIEAANNVLIVLASLPGDRLAALPAQYTVRQWTSTRDSFWVISGLPWVYNNPWEWRRLYNANREKLPQPNNPDLILPGMIIDIPSIRGETRQGMWEEGRTYPALP